MNRTVAAFLLGAAPLVAGCYSWRAPRGGGQVDLPPAPITRHQQPKDVAVPVGYRVEKVADGLTFPTGLAFDDRDRLYVVESGYADGESWAKPRLLRLEPDDRWSVVAEGDRNGPWTGAVYSKGYFYVIEGGKLENGRLLKIDSQGRTSAVVEGLPGRGDFPAGAPVLGPDGYLYFGQGTATNAGVVGEDNRSSGWADRFPSFHDVPCRDVALTGANFRSGDALTGAFLPFGMASRPGQVVPGALPCSGSILRLRPEGGPLELVAWGLRDPFGLAFSTWGQLYAVDAGYDERGSRPVWGAADLLWAVRSGRWYGWPDFSGDRPLSSREFAGLGPPPPALLASPPERPPRPAALFACQAFSRGIDFSRSEAFGHLGDAFVAQSGDRSPLRGKVLAPVGFKIVRVRMDDGLVEDFAVNKGPRNGPASLLKSGGFERPVSVKFDPGGASLYVVDYGVVTASAKGLEPRKGTGALWRISRRD